MKIDGKQISDEITVKLKIEVDLLKKRGITPHLHILTLSPNEESVSYVKQKMIRAETLGARITIEDLGNEVSTGEVVAKIQLLNEKGDVHGIIVQRPMPPQIDEKAISEGVTAQKDVDGFHPASLFETPVALAVVELLKRGMKQDDIYSFLKTKKITVVGRGLTAGGPIIRLFRKNGIEPEVVSSQTPNSKEILLLSDIIVSAVGKKDVIKVEMIKEDAVLIGVGLHMEDGKLRGDYNDLEVSAKVSYFTPTPGGVGPVNVTMLFKNLIKSASS